MICVFQSGRTFYQWNPNHRPTLHDRSGSELPGVLILAQHFHLKDGVGHGFTHNAFDLDDVFFRQAICLLIGSAQFVIIEHRCSRSKNRKHCILPCLRPFLCSLPLLFSRAFTPIPRRTGGDERHILHLLRHKIRKTGRLSLSVEEVSGFHSHL